MKVFPAVSFLAEGLECKRDSNSQYQASLGVAFR